MPINNILYISHMELTSLFSEIVLVQMGISYVYIIILLDRNIKAQIEVRAYVAKRPDNAGQGQAF